jgi:hypothetical protein
LARAPKYPSLNPVQRYDRKSSSEIKVWGEIKIDYEPKSNNQKIGILKRIIEHYNIKSMEKTFESSTLPTMQISSTSRTTRNPKVLARTNWCL